MTKLYRKAKTVRCHDTGSNKTQVIRAHVVNELINHIEEYCDSLPMADMTTLRDKPIASLGFSSIRCNTTCS